jgi:dihydroorotate dehydrogenase (fumarate)
MADLTTKFMGLELKNPIIVGSCSLTSTIEDIIQLEQNGAAAIVLKSLFEEEILNEAEASIKEAKENKLIYTQLSETLDYIDVHTKEKRLSDYLSLIKEAKKKTLIPIIASINCISDSGWTDFASKIQDSGADGLELNIFLNPVDPTNNDFLKTAQKIIKKVLKTITIPVSVKLSDCIADLSNIVLELSSSGIAGLVLFNRFYNPDIDIYNLSVIPGKMHSCENEYAKPLRWIALLSDKAKCSIAASTGIHDGNTMIKQLLVGADAVQVVSTLYLNGKKQINQMLSEIEKWMLDKGYFSVNQFKGLSSYKNASNPAVFERIQFMKYYGRIG